MKYRLDVLVACFFRLLPKKKHSKIVTSERTMHSRGSQIGDPVMGLWCTLVRLLDAPVNRIQLVYSISEYNRWRSQSRDRETFFLCEPSSPRCGLIGHTHCDQIRLTEMENRLGRRGLLTNGSLDRWPTLKQPFVASIPFSSRDRASLSPLHPPSYLKRMIIQLKSIKRRFSILVILVKRLPFADDNWTREIKGKRHTFLSFLTDCFWPESDVLESALLIEPSFCNVDSNLDSNLDSNVDSNLD